MVKNGPGMIPDNICDHLQFSACDLFLRKQDRMKIVGNGPCQGVIETDGKHYMVGTRGGILFKAQVTTDGGEYQVNFLLGEDDLVEFGKVMMDQIQNGEMKNVWGQGRGKIPLSELYNFADLKRTRLGKPLN